MERNLSVTRGISLAGVVTVVLLVACSPIPDGRDGGATDASVECLSDRTRKLIRDAGAPCCSGYSTREGGSPYVDQGVCSPAPPAGGLLAGDRCADDADCESRRCVQQRDISSDCVTWFFVCKCNGPFCRAGYEQIWGTGVNDVWVLGHDDFGCSLQPVDDAGFVMHWDGTAWTRLVSGMRWYGRAIGGSSASDVWLSEQHSMRHWDGGTWASVPWTLNGFPSGIFATSPTDAWAVGSTLPDAHIAHWDGASWALVDAGVTAQPQSLWGSGPSDVWAVGGGPIVHWDGETWREFSNPTSNQLISIFGTSANDIWAVGTLGRPIHWDGASWSLGSTAFSAILTAVWGSAPNDYWIAGTGGFLAHFDGGTWTPVDTRTHGGWNGLWGSGPGDIWLVGGDIQHLP